MICVSTGSYSSANRYEAEIRGYNKYLMVDHEQFADGSSVKIHSPTIKTAMLIRLSKQQMSVTNYYGYNIYRQDPGLFKFDTMYMGLNRVIQSSNTNPTDGRTGRGLCSVCIYFLKETARDLYSTPVLPPPPPKDQAYPIHHYVPFVPIPVDGRGRKDGFRYGR